MVSKPTNAPVKATPANLLQNLLRVVHSFGALTMAFSLDPISATLFLSCCPYRMTSRTNLQASVANENYKPPQNDPLVKNYWQQQSVDSDDQFRGFPFKIFRHCFFCG
jgi:hypothetical protein